MNRRRFLTGVVAAPAANTAIPAKEDMLAVISGDRFRLAAIDYNLSNVVAPSIYALAKGAEKYANTSRRALEDILRSETFTIHDSGQRSRWGAKVVTVTMNDTGSSVQEMLVERGAVRVSPATPQTGFIDKLLALENTARLAASGLWALKEYRVRAAANAWDSVGAFNVVAGRVVDAASVKGRHYLNFGEDYREDFTATIRSRLVRSWEKSGYQFDKLRNAHLRIRGFVNLINGPSISVVHLQQIEVIDQEGDPSEL